MYLSLHDSVVLLSFHSQRKRPDCMVKDYIAFERIINQGQQNEVRQIQCKTMEESKVNSKQIESRSNEVKKLQIKLRENFIETNEVLREYKQKECIYTKLIDDECKNESELRQEIDEIEKKITNFCTFKETLDKAIEDLRPFEDTIDKIVLKMDLFHSKEELLDRINAMREYYHGRYR